MTSMTNRTSSFVAPIVACALLVFSTGSPAAGPQQDIDVLADGFREFMAARGVTTEAIKVSKELAPLSDGSLAAAGCTASVTLSVPGGTKAELSATTANCKRAIDMLRAAADAYAKAENVGRTKR